MLSQILAALLLLASGQSIEIPRPAGSSKEIKYFACPMGSLTGTLPKKYDGVGKHGKREKCFLVPNFKSGIKFAKRNLTRRLQLP